MTTFTVGGRETENCQKRLLHLKNAISTNPSSVHWNQMEEFTARMVANLPKRDILEKQQKRSMSDPFGNPDFGDIARRLERIEDILGRLLEKETYRGQIPDKWGITDSSKN